MKLVNKRTTHYIGRGSALGNPFTHLPLGRTKALVQVPTIEDAVACFDVGHYYLAHYANNPSHCHQQPAGGCGASAANLDATAM
jgi:hypothetical protein